MFALIYFSPGIDNGVFYSFICAVCAIIDLGMGKVGIIGAIGLIPFVLKIFLDILSDKVNFFGLGF